MCIDGAVLYKLLKRPSKITLLQPNIHHKKACLIVFYIQCMHKQTELF